MKLLSNEKFTEMISTLTIEQLKSISCKHKDQQKIVDMRIRQLGQYYTPRLFAKKAVELLLK